MFLPLKDDNPTIRTPYVTMILIAINVGVYLFQATLDQQPEVHFIYQFGLVPAWLSGPFARRPARRMAAPLDHAFQLHVPA